MKKLTILLFITTITVLNAFSQIPSWLPANGLELWMPFNGNANDESGNANHGTPNGAVLIQDRHGKPDSAYYFNGTSDYIRCINPGPTGGGSRSVTFWVKMDTSDLGTIFSYGNNDSGPTDFSVKTNIFCGGALLGDRESYSEACNSIISNRWQFFAMIYDNNVGVNLSYAKIYRNDSLQTSLIQNSAGTTNTGNVNPITIGCYHWLGYSGNKLFFPGVIDDITFHSRAITECEAHHIYIQNTTDVISDPQSVNISMNSDTAFVVYVISGNHTYQWQVDTGSGFYDLADDVIYLGTDSNVLILTNVPLYMDNYSYRCIINGICTDTSASAVLNVYDATGISTQTERCFSVYPNPAGAEFYIETDVDSSDYYYISDCTGRVILYGMLAGKKTKLSTDKLSAGLYFIRIDNFVYKLFINP